MSVELGELHQILLGTKPVAMQERLYAQYPSMLGYSSRQRDPQLFEAVLILALHQARKKAGDSELHKVYFLAPATLADGWVLTQFKSSAKRIFERLKTGKSVEAVKHVGALFHEIMLGSQAFSLPSEPPRWTAFGFLRSDPIPEWMGPKLLESES